MRLSTETRRVRRWTGAGRPPGCERSVVLTQLWHLLQPFSVAWKEVWRKHSPIRRSGHKGSGTGVLGPCFHGLHDSLLNGSHLLTAVLGCFWPMSTFTGLLDISANTAHLLSPRTLSCFPLLPTSHAPTPSWTAREALGLRNAVPCPSNPQAGDKTSPAHG